MTIKLPNLGEGKDSQKYVWLHIGKEDYVDWCDGDYSHKNLINDMVAGLGLNVEDIAKEAIRDAGGAYVNPKRRLIRILTRSYEYGDRSNPEDFKRLIEDNSDFKVEINYI